jgi:peptide methionine sulfoxide reductase MsrB
VDWLVYAISEKHAVSTFRAEVMNQKSEGPYICRVAGGKLFSNLLY